MTAASSITLLRGGWLAACDAGVHRIILRGEVAFQAEDPVRWAELRRACRRRYRPAGWFVLACVEASESDRRVHMSDFYRQQGIPDRWLA